MIKAFVRLSVTKFDPNFLRTGKTELAEIFYDIYGKKPFLKKKFVCKVAGRAGAEGRNSNFSTT